MEQLPVSDQEPRSTADGLDAASAPPAAVPVAQRVTTPQERRRAFALLFASLTCLGMGQTVIFAILPPVSRQLGFADFQVGGIFMVSAVLWMLMSPFWGRKSDLWGRKPVIMCGLVGFSVSTFLFASVLNGGLDGSIGLLLLYPLLILSRTIYGALGPGAMSAAQAYVADRTTLETRVTALAAMGSAFGLGTTLGPGLVSILSGFGLLAPLYGVGLFAGLSAIAVAVLLPERTDPKERTRQPPMRFADPRIRGLLILSTLLSAAHAVSIQTVTFFLMDRLGLAPEDGARMAGWVLMVSSIAALAAPFAVMPLLQWSARRYMRIGSFLCAAGFALLTLGPGYASVMLAMVVVGFGFAMARSGAIGAASLRVTAHEQGAASGLMGATGGAGFILAPLIAFPLYGLASVAPYAASFALTGAVALWLVRPDPQNRP